MNREEYIHTLKQIATLMNWIEEREKEAPRRRVDYVKTKVIKRCYRLLDYAFKYIPESEPEGVEEIGQVL